MPARISRKNSQQTVIPSEPRLCSSLVHFLNHLGGLFGQSHWAKPVVPCLTGHLRRAQVPDETLVERGCGRRDSVARAPSAQQGDRAIEAWFHDGFMLVHVSFCMEYMPLILQTTSMNVGKYISIPGPSCRGHLAGFAPAHHFF